MKNFIFLLPLLILLSACDWQHENPTDSTSNEHKMSNRVVTVSYPLQYLTQRIVTDDIEVEFPAGDADDPRVWKPTIEDISRMQKADLIITNGPGIDYADWLIKVTLPDSKFCATSEALALSDFIKVKGIDIVHSHGPEGEHSHPFMIAYSWLDPAVAKKQAAKIAGRLSKVYPDRAERFSANLKSLANDLDELQKSIASLSEKPTQVSSANPNTKFFTRAAGITEAPTEWNIMPNGTNEDQLALFDRASVSPESVLLTRPAGTKLGEFLKSRSKTAIQIDLLDKRPTSGDYLSVMRENIRRLEAAQ